MNLTRKQIDALRAYAEKRKGELAELITDAADTIEILHTKLSELNGEKPNQYYHDGWILCSEKLPKKNGWYICSIKGGNVNALYYTGKTWIDNVRKHMFELYDITSKLTGMKISPEKESVYWDGWVIAWMPLPEAYKGDK